jgi:hypothetical protein
MSEQPSGPTTSSGRRGADKRRRPRQQRTGNAPLVDLATLTTPPEVVVLNQFLASEKDAERERQRIRQAESAKDKAAARLKELRESNAGKDEVAEADQAYRDALDALARVKAGEPAAPAAHAVPEADPVPEADAIEQAQDVPGAGDEAPPVEPTVADAVPEADALEQAQDAGPDDEADRPVG